MMSNKAGELLQKTCKEGSHVKKQVMLRRKSIQIRLKNCRVSVEVPLHLAVTKCRAVRVEVP